jgi:iron(III) transport system permease protein
MSVSSLKAERLPRSSRRFDLWPGAMLAVVIAVSILIVLQLLIVLGLSFFEGELGGETGHFGIENYLSVFGDAFTFRVIVNTIWFSLTTLIVSMAFGIPAAWLVERTDFPGKTVLFTLMTLGLLIPGFTSAMGWLFLLHPRIGLLNTFLMDLFALQGPLFSITNVWGMGWVQGLNLAPIAFIMTAAAFRAMDPALEEAAYMSRAGFRRTWLAITARLVWPSILAASIYIFTIGFAAFDVPAVIGWSARIYTFSTYMVSLINVREGLPEYGTVAALSTSIVAFAGILSWWYGRVQRRARQYEVVSGKGYRPRIIQLKGWVWPAWIYLGLFFLCSKLLPLLILIWVSLLPYVQLPSVESFQTVSLNNFSKIDWSLAGHSIANTAILMFLVPTLTLIISVAFSWIVLRSRISNRGIFDTIAFLPHAVPNIVFGIATMLVTLFVIDRIVPIYGTIWILALVFIIGRLSYATRMTNGGLIQINRELDESAQMGGANTGSVLWSILCPLLGPTLLYAWLWIALMCYRELTLAVLITKYENMTLPVLIWSTWATGQQGTAAALGLIMLVAMVPLVVLYWVVARRLGFGAQG